jgi:RNA polymerase sigma factor (sigma-70 family)
MEGKGMDGAHACPKERHALIEAHLDTIANWVKYWRGRIESLRRMDRDDLFQQACLHVVKAAARHDEARADWKTWLAWAVRGAVTRICTARRQVSACSLDAKGDEDGRPLWASLPAPQPDACPVETRDAAGRLLALAKGRARAILQLHYIEGRTLAETGEALGVSGKRVEQLLPGILTRLRKAVGRNRHDNGLGMQEWRRDNPEAAREADAKREKNQKKGAAEWARARQAMGLVPSVGLCVQCPEARVLYGPFRSQEEALAAFPDAGPLRTMDATRRRVVGNDLARRLGKQGWRFQPAPGRKPGEGPRDTAAPGARQP